MKLYKTSEYNDVILTLILKILEDYCLHTPIRYWMFPNSLVVNNKMLNLADRKYIYKQLHFENLSEKWLKTQLALGIASKSAQER